jgi:hypothetical protein
VRDVELAGRSAEEKRLGAAVKVVGGAAVVEGL